MRVTLTLLESTGIQEYIFGSNNLRTSVGASALVTRATSEWIVRALDDLKMSHNAIWDEDMLSLDYRPTMQIGNSDGEIIYAGGGNGLLLFQGEAEQHAIPFVKRWTRYLLRRARGLNVVVRHRSFEWKDASHVTSMAKEHTELRKQAAVEKLARLPDVPLPGLGVTAACVFTGLPATKVYPFTVDDTQPQPVSIEALDKLASYATANKGLDKVLPRVREKYEFVYDFDNFGEPEETSYLAIVHTDGNAMGKRFQSLAKAFESSDQDEDYVKRLRELSKGIQKRATSALQDTGNLLLELVEWDDVDKQKKIAGVVPIPVRNKKRKQGNQVIVERQELFPFRPIVFGGDDTTFVCEGRLGLTAARFYLERLAEGNLVEGEAAEEWGGPLYARGGVAVVKSHFPFARAYALSQELARSAKVKLSEWQTAQAINTGAMLDWHFSTSGIVAGLTDIREREYVADTGKSLLMRPLLLTPDRETKLSASFWRTWGTFDNVMKNFETEWGERRNKVKALRDALRRGPNGVKLFLAQYDEEGLPEIQGQPDMRGEGWDAGECGYFDAIEALDFWVPLERKG